MVALVCSICGRDITREVKYRAYQHVCSCKWSGSSYRKQGECPNCGKLTEGIASSGFICRNCTSPTSQTVGQMAKASLTFARNRDKLERESIDDIEVSVEYRAVKRLLELNVSPILVMGKAGTGKSTLIRYLRAVLPTKNIVVVAPTGIAALNAKGATIHSFFRLRPALLQEADIEVVHGRTLYKYIDILIIDEISMVRADLLDGIHWFLAKNGKSANCLFGGTQVIMIGDIFQLPPVAPQREAQALTSIGYASPFFFSAKCLKKESLLPVELTHVYRQKDIGFIDILNRVRIGEDSAVTVEYLNRHCSGRVPVPNAVTLATTNEMVDEKNNRELHKIPCDEMVFMGKAEGSFAVEDARLPSPMRLVLKPGAQVMFTKNDEAKRWVNGTIGRMLSIEDTVIRVELLTNKPGNICEVTPVEWKSYSYRLDSQSEHINVEATGDYTQYPLMLAWAVTIHKAQGRTLDSVHIDFGRGTFDFGQAYVALSRCKTLQGITLERPIRSGDISCSLVLKAFHERLTHAIPDIEDLASQTSSGPTIDGKYNVVGIQYGDCIQKDRVPPKKSVVSIIRESENPYDKNAIRVEWEGYLVGHIPRTCNQELAACLSKGAQCCATVIESLVSEDGVLSSMAIDVRLVPE